MTTDNWKPIAASVNEQYPHIRQAVLDAAELALANRHVLPGTGGEARFVGDPIDWAGESVSDREYAYTLNRMSHWAVLCQANALTGESRYTDKLLSEWSDWLDRCPSPDLSASELENTMHGDSRWRLLEIGLRAAGSWAIAGEYCTANGILPPALAEKIALSLRWHGTFLAKYSPMFWPHADHNHHLMEMVGLLHIACRYPELPEAMEWRTLAIERIELCMEVQITDCGGQIEGCPHYHNVTLRFFNGALELARDHGIVFSASFTERYHNAIAYSLHATRSNGSVVPWGDSDVSFSSVEMALGAYRTLGDIEPLRVLAQIVDPAVFTQLLETYIWQIPDLDALMDVVRRPPQTLPAQLMWHRGLGQVSARTGWAAGALCLFFGCKMPQGNGHAHIDPLSFDFSAFGRPILVDPGRFCYRQNEDRRLFKSAFSHNMLTINEREPFEYRSSWHFGAQRSGSIENVSEGERFMAMVGTHDNYFPAVHTRTVALIDGRYLLILDRVTGLDALSSVQLNYHFDSTNAIWDRTTKTTHLHCGTVAVALHVAVGNGANHLLGEVLSARVSDKLDVAHESQRLKIQNTHGETTRVFATLVHVSDDSPEPMPKVHLFTVGVSPESDVRCEFAVGENRYECINSDAHFTVTVRPN